MRRGAAAFALLLAWPAAAETRLGVRVGSHADHGRVVVDARGRLDYRVEQEGGRVVLRLAAPGGLELPTLRRPLRNVTALEPVEGGLAIAVSPGVRVRHFRLDNRIVVDLLDPAPAAPAPERQVARPAQPSRPSPAQAATPQPATPPAPIALPSEAPSSRPPSPRPPSIASADGTLAVPVPMGTGAALLRRGSRWLFVLDAPVPLDLAPLRAEPRLASTELVLLPRGTVLSLPAEGVRDPHLSRAGST